MKINSQYIPTENNRTENRGRGEQTLKRDEEKGEEKK